MSADIINLPVRGEHPHSYTALLLRDDVSVGELLHALRFTSIHLTTDPVTGQNVIHRTDTKPAA